MNYKIKDFLLEHYKILLTVLVSSPFFAVSFTKYRYIILLKFEIWKYLVSLFLIYAIYLLVLKINTPKQVKSYLVKKPDEIITDFGKKDKYSLDWKVLMGCDSQDFSSRRIFVEGPFCKKCSYLLDHDDPSFWFCVVCEKKYHIPKYIRICPMEKVTKIFEAELSKS
jgi:hypothetical protein